MEPLKLEDITSSYDNFSIEDKKKILSNYGYLIARETSGNEELHRIAINNSPDNFALIKNPSYEICKYAVKKDPELLQVVENQTEELQKIAVYADPNTIRFCKNPSDKLIIKSIKHNPNNLEHVVIKIKNAKEDAIKNNDTVLLDKLKKLLDRYYKLAFKLDKHSIRWIEDQTEEMAIEAIKFSSNTFKYIKNQTRKIIEKALELYPHFCWHTVSNIKQQELHLDLIEPIIRINKYYGFNYLNCCSEDFFKEAVEYNKKHAYRVIYLKNATDEMYKCAIGIDHSIFKRIENPSEELKNFYKCITL